MRSVTPQRFQLPLTHRRQSYSRDAVVVVDRNHLRLVSLLGRQELANTAISTSTEYGSVVLRALHAVHERWVHALDALLQRIHVPVIQLVPVCVKPVHLLVAPSRVKERPSSQIINKLPTRHSHSTREDWCKQSCASPRTYWNCPPASCRTEARLYDPSRSFIHTPRRHTSPDTSTPSSSPVGCSSHSLYTD